MAVLFAPQYRDPNAELKQYMLQMAQLIGSKRTAGKERAKVKSFAESISPPDITTINDQRLFSPAGQQIAQDAWLGDDPNVRAELGKRPGQQTLSTQQIMQRALMSGDFSMSQALQFSQLGRPATSLTESERGKAERIGAGLLPRATQPKLTESQQLQAEGYTSEEIRRIKDIKHGIEPRASNRITYDRMTAVEKAKYLSTERTKAEGRYFGMILSEGVPEPARQPDYLAWIVTEEEKVKQELGITKTKPESGADFVGGVLDRVQADRETPSPKTKAEYDAIAPGTEFIDTDGKKKVKR